MRVIPSGSIRTVLCGAVAAGTVVLSSCGGGAEPLDPEAGRTLQVDVIAEGPITPAALTLTLGDRTIRSSGTRSVTFQGVPLGAYLLSVTGLSAGCTVVGRPTRDISFGGSGGSVLAEAANPRYRTSIQGSGLRAVVDIGCTSEAPRDLVFTAGTSASERRDAILASADGSLLRNISNGSTNTVSRPVWAPDGASLAFFAAAEATFTLVVAAADGSGQHAVATGHNSSYATPPDNLRWSRDGSALVFWSGADGGSLHTVRLDGGGETTVPLPSGLLSPDGARYAYVDPAGLHVMELATGTSVLIGPAVGIPAWSPDGARIAFGTGLPALCEPGDIFAADAGGGNVVNLTATSDVHEYGPVWSPDGSKLAFGFWRGCESEQPVGHLGIVTPGSAPVDVATGARLFSRFAWSPDGTKLAFVGAIGHGCGREVGCLSEDLYIADLVKPGSHRVTHGVFADFPAWNPSP